MSGVERPPHVPGEVISTVYATNVMGVLHMTQAALDIFKKRPDGGRGDIIMLGSIAGREPYAGGTVSLLAGHSEHCTSNKSLDILLQQSRHPRLHRFSA